MISVLLDYPLLKVSQVKPNYKAHTLKYLVIALSEGPIFKSFIILTLLRNIIEMDIRPAVGKGFKWTKCPAFIVFLILNQPNHLLWLISGINKTIEKMLAY